MQIRNDDPCREPLSYWGNVDKPTIVAELPATCPHYSASNMLSCALTNGFSGDLFWALNDPHFPLGPALSAITNITRREPVRTSYESLLSWLHERRAVTMQATGAVPRSVRANPAVAVGLEATKQAITRAGATLRPAVAKTAVHGPFVYDKNFSRRAFLATL